MLRQILCLLLLAAFAVDGNAQDPIFSQFYSAPLMLNPAFAGNTYEPRIAMNYRNQFPAVVDGSTAFATYAVSYEQFVPSLNSGVGLLIKTDNAGGGLYKTTKVGFTYAYRVQLNDNFNVKIGVEAGFRQINLDYNKLVFFDQLNPLTGSVDPSGNPNPSNEIPPDATNTTNFDVGAGILVYNSVFYGGISIKHLNTPNENLLNINNGISDGLSMRVSVHGGAQFTLREGNNRHPSTFISPNILVVKQGNQGQVNAGAYISWRSVFFGGWFRYAYSNSDAIIGLIGYQWDIFKLGYSYDATVSSLSSAPSGGAHEISLVLNFDNSARLKAKRHAERYNDCFKIFR